MRSQTLACDTYCLLVKIFLLIKLKLCLEIDMKIIKREVVYSSFLFISVFFLFCVFQFLDIPSQKNTLSDFHQKVAFNQYFYLHQELGKK